MFDRSIDWLVKHPRLFKVVNPVVSLIICNCPKHTMRRCLIGLFGFIGVGGALFANGNNLAGVFAFWLAYKYSTEGMAAYQQHTVEENMKESMKNIGTLIDALRPPVSEEEEEEKPVTM